MRRSTRAWFSFCIHRFRSSLVSADNQFLKREREKKNAILSTNSDMSLSMEKTRSCQQMRVTVLQKHPTNHTTESPQEQQYQTPKSTSMLNRECRYESYCPKKQQFQQFFNVLRKIEHNNSIFQTFRRLSRRLKKNLVYLLGNTECVFALANKRFLIVLPLWPDSDQFKSVGPSTEFSIDWLNLTISAVCQV